MCPCRQNTGHRAICHLALGVLGVFLVFLAARLAVLERLECQRATGQHRRYTAGEPVADLMIAIAGGLGLDLPTFGDDGTRPLAGIRVA